MSPLSSQVARRLTSRRRFGIFAFPQAKAGKGTSRPTVQGATETRAGKVTVKNAGH